jgi:sulfur carrier protein ThiS
MKNENKIDELTQKILRGLEESYEKLVAFKKYKNSPLIVEKNGAIVEIKPDEIQPKTRYSTSHES